MEMLLYQSTQFRDVKKILDRAHGFADRKSTRLNSSHWNKSRMPSSA